MTAAHRLRFDHFRRGKFAVRIGRGFYFTNNTYSGESRWFLRLGERRYALGGRRG